MPMCYKCQIFADHTTEYCPSHTCKICGESGHVSRVCTKREVSPFLKQKISTALNQTVPTVPILPVAKTVQTLPSVNSGAPVSPSKSEVPTVLIWGNQRPRVPILPDEETVPVPSENSGAPFETPSKSESESQSFSTTSNESLESQLKQTQSSEITQTPTEIIPVAGPSRGTPIKTEPIQSSEITQTPTEIIPVAGPSRNFHIKTESKFHVKQEIEASKELVIESSLLDSIVVPNPVKETVETVKVKEYSLKGLIKGFDNEISAGTILYKNRRLAFSQENSKFDVGDYVTFDLINNEDVSNVCLDKEKSKWDQKQLDELRLVHKVAQKRKKEKKKEKKEEKKEKKKRKKESAITSSLCILDVQFLNCFENDQLIQIGCMFWNNEINRGFFTPIQPIELMSQKSLKNLNLTKLAEGYTVYRRSIEPPEPDKPCCSEEKALKDFLNHIETDINDGKIALYVVDLDIIMPKLKEKLQKYDLLRRFQKKVKWVCDLKSIVRSKESLKHFKTCCWPNFNLIFEHINDADFPYSPRTMINAQELAEYLWATTLTLFEADDLQECEEFINYFYDSKVLLKSDLPMSSIEEQKPKEAKWKLRYQSCVFDIVLGNTIPPMKKFNYDDDSVKKSNISRFSSSTNSLNSLPSTMSATPARPFANLSPCQYKNKQLAPKREQTYEEVSRTQKFAEECLELLKHLPQCRLPLNKFIPAYHQHFGRQCRLADYGFTKLIELIEAIPTIIEITEELDSQLNSIRILQPVKLQGMQ